MNDSHESPLSEASIDAAVLQRFPDYAAVLFVAKGLTPGPSSEHSERLLRDAEAKAMSALGGREPHELPEVLAWRAAYQAFGVKPREARSSVEALLRRVNSGLPRINRLADTYNAISVAHLIPIGGEDLRGYAGPPRLVVAAGGEPFDTMANGEPVTESAAAGEIVWRDDVGVTCRRWNWRQCVRTRLTEGTTEGLFIIDGLGADAAARARSAAEALMEALAVESPGARFTVRTLPSKDL